MSKDNDGGRVTTREFYEALLDQNKQRADMERRIITKIDDGITAHTEFQISTEARLAAGNVKFKNLEDDIDKLKLWDRGLGVLSVISSTLAGIIGSNK